MADERLSLEFDLRGAGAAASGISQVASAIGGIGQGGGIGGIGTALGAVGRLGAFTNALGLAVTALGAFASVAKGASDSLRGFGRLRDTAGSTSAEAALATVLGNSIGISDIRSLGARARAGISSGMGAAQAAQIGIGPQFDIGTPVNELKIALALMQDIVDTAAEFGQGAALIRARNYGIEELIELASMSKSEMQKALEEAKEIERTYTPERIRQAREFNREMGRLERNFERIKTDIGARVLPTINSWLDSPEASTAQALTFGIGSAIARFFEKRAAGGNKAVDENTKKLEELADTLRTTNGIFGGAGRARNAIPKQFGPAGGYMVSQALRANAIRLGAYSISM